MEKIKLSNGLEMPILGFGVYQINDLVECEQSVVDAIATGYRMIDTAAAYSNEEAVGKAIKRSGIAREELFITSKLWVQDVSYEAAKKAYEVSLEKLQLDYLDLYLIHQPYNDVYGAWRAMEELYKEGKVKAIGVSNFERAQLVDFVINNEITPMVNQIELHPFIQKDKDIAVMKEYNIQPEGWAPFAEGKNDIFKNEVLSTIAKKYNKTIAQVIVRWHIDRNIVVIPKSVHLDRIKENFDVFDFSLNEEDMGMIATINEDKSFFVDHAEPDTVKSMNGYKLHD